MKYSISESQFKKFFNIGTERGPFSSAIEDLIGGLGDDPNVCDYAVSYVESNDTYIVLIITNMPTSSKFSNDITKLIRNYLGINALVMANDSYGCKNSEEI